jgi:hypothetical protein
MHIDPDRVLIAADRHFSKVKSDRVEWIMDAAMVADVFQNTVD